MSRCFPYPLPGYERCVALIELIKVALDLPSYVLLVSSGVLPLIGSSVIKFGSPS